MENESNKQTAVEWLFKQLWNEPKDKLAWYAILKQAKAIEKQQMWEYINKNYCIGPKSLEFHRLEFEQYYAETYGAKK
jgi:hypothetical protein